MSNLYGFKAPEGPVCARCNYPVRPGLRGPCMRCEEVEIEKAHQDDLWASALGGQKAWLEYSFDKMEITPINKSLIERAKKFDPRADNFFIHGPRGSGKSHLAAAMKRKFVIQGMLCKTILIDDALSEAKAYIQNHAVQRNMVAQLVNVPLLSLEDMGVEKASDFSLNFVYQVINGRYLARKAGLIVTSNESLKGLEELWARFDPHGRVPSRLEEMCSILSFNGEQDWRRKHRPE